MPTRPEIALAWYSPEEWERWKRSVPDGEIFEETYDEWAALAERRIEAMTARGVVVRRMPVKLGKFLTWCRKRKVAPDGGARAAYAGELLRKQESGTNRRKQSP